MRPPTLLGVGWPCVPDPQLTVSIEQAERGSPFARTWPSGQGVAGAFPAQDSKPSETLCCDAAVSSRSRARSRCTAGTWFFSLGARQTPMPSSSRRPLLSIQGCIHLRHEWTRVATPHSV